MFAASFWVELRLRLQLVEVSNGKGFIYWKLIISTIIVKMSLKILFKALILRK